MGGIPRRRWWDAFGPKRFAAAAVAVPALLAGALWHRHPAGIAVLVAALLLGFFVVLRPAIRQAEFGFVGGARHTVDTLVAGVTRDLEAGREEIENCAQLLADEPQQAVEWVHEAWTRALQEWRGPGGPALREYLFSQLAAVTLARGATPPAEPHSEQETGVLAYLPPRQRVVFVLCQVAHFGPDEVAAMIGQPADLVAQELRAAEDTVVTVEGT